MKIIKLLFLVKSSFSNGQKILFFLYVYMSYMLLAILPSLDLEWSKMSLHGKGLGASELVNTFYILRSFGLNDNDT